MQQTINPQGIPFVGQNSYMPAYSSSYPNQANSNYQTMFNAYPYANGYPSNYGNGYQAYGAYGYGNFPEYQNYYGYPYNSYGWPYQGYGKRDCGCGCGGIRDCS